MYESNEAHMREVTATYQEAVIRLNSLCRVYSQADRVLTGDPVSVIVVEDGPAPAWSDGRDIFINKSQINDLDLDELIGINGLNYHELAHHLFTPRRSTALAEKIIKAGQSEQTQLYMLAFNGLEDQRIETLLVGKYPAVVPYLTHTVVRWLRNTPEDLAVNYIFVRGRRYLPLDLRIAFRDSFMQPHLIPVVADIVDKYRVLVFPADYDKAFELIKRFKREVLDKLNMPNMNGGPNKCGSRAPIKSGRPDTGEQQARAMSRGAGIGDAEPKFEAPPQPPDSNANAASDDSSNTNTPPPEPSWVAPKTAEEALAMREAAARAREAMAAANDNKLPAMTPGNAHVPSVGGVPDNIADILNAIESDIQSDREVLRDVRTKQKAITGSDKHSETIKRGKYDETPVPPSVLAIARRFSRELQQLKESCEPTWLHERPAGRVNVQRVIRGCTIDEAFDQWDDGVDVTNIEVVILVDRSGSMTTNNNDARASEACWVLKRSLDMIDVPTTVYSFDSDSEVVFDKNNKANKTSFPFLHGQGGTSPERALISTERMLMTSSKKNKIMFIVTDGAFGSTPNDDIIARLNKMGVLTVLLLIADVTPEQVEQQASKYGNTNAWHNCRIYGVVSTANDMLPFARQIVLDVMKKSSRR